MAYKVLRFPVLDSTNAKAETFLRGGNIKEDTVLCAEYQEYGRGQGQNVWMSESGQNLLFSWILFPEFLSVNKQFLLSKVVALAMAGFLREYEIKANIKWPNDILYEEKKLGGILIEHSILGQKLKHSIVGVGLNVNQAHFADFPLPASSMKNITGNSYDIETIVDVLMTHLYHWYDLLRSGAIDMINAAYLERLYKLNESCRFSSSSGEFAGTIRGVSHLGELLVEVGDEVKNYGFHSIKMLH